MSTTQTGYTPLMAAALHGKWDVVIELLNNGAEVNAQNNVSYCVHNFHSSSHQFQVSSYIWNILEL